MIACRKGYVYVLSNPSMPGIVKIGRSMHGGTGRAEAFYRNDTGLPTPFDLEFEVLVDDCHALERDVHVELADWRANPQREFFRLDADSARHFILQRWNLVIGAIDSPEPRTHAYIEYAQDFCRPQVEDRLGLTRGCIGHSAFNDAVEWVSRQAGLMAIAYSEMRAEREWLANSKPPREPEAAPELAANPAATPSVTDGVLH